MKLKKIKLNQIADTTLNEREMLRLFGTGTPGCCQCGCHYAGEPGGSSSSANQSANYKGVPPCDYEPCDYEPCDYEPCDYEPCPPPGGGFPGTAAWNCLGITNPGQVIGC